MKLLTQRPDDIIGNITPPEQIKNLTEQGGSAGLAIFISSIIYIIYVIAGIVFLFMIIFGAFQWITSGGDKEALTKARGRIINAIIGFVLLALSMVIVTIISNITGFKILNAP